MIPIFLFELAKASETIRSRVAIGVATGTVVLLRLHPVVLLRLHEDVTLPSC